MEQSLMQLTRNVAYEKEFKSWKNRALAIPAEAKALIAKLKDATSCQVAVTWCAEQKAMADTVKKSWLGGIVELRKRRFEHSKAVLDLIVKPCVAAEREVKAKIELFLKDQEIKRLKEQARLAEKQAKQEQTIRALTANKLTQQGQTKKAAQILKAPVTLPSPALPEIKIDGMYSTKVWQIECVDKLAFIEFVLENAKKRPELLASLDINEGWFMSQANKLDGNLNYPGIVCGTGHRIAIKSGVAAGRPS